MEIDAGHDLSRHLVSPERSQAVIQSPAMASQSGPKRMRPGILVFLSDGLGFAHGIEFRFNFIHVRFDVENGRRGVRRRSNNRGIASGRLTHFVLLGAVAPVTDVWREPRPM